MHAAKCLSRRALSLCQRRLLAGGPAVVHADAPAVPLLEVRPYALLLCPSTNGLGQARLLPYLVMSGVCSFAAILEDGNWSVDEHESMASWVAVSVPTA